MPEPSQRTVLVTGAAGFIGSHVAEALLARGDRVVGLDNLDAFYAEPLKRANLDEIARSPNGGAFSFVQGDIREADAVNQLVAQERPQVIVHLAARAGVRPSILQPALYADVNLRGTANLLEAARTHGVRTFAMASSSSVYGNNEKTPFAEDDDVNEPISPYAATKRSCELLAHTFHHLYDLPVASLRFFTVFGPRQRPDLAIMKFMRMIANEEPIPVFGDGSMARDFTFIDDIVRGVLASIDRIGAHGYRIWNLGSDRPVRLDAMIDAIGRTVGKSPIIDRKPNQPGDVDRTWADLTRAKAELGYTTPTTFDDGLARQWEWLKPRL
ncbi:MAG: SDR family NAD(P)-dependent oxidoreductase [Phycisphaerales bacterium]